MVVSSIAPSATPRPDTADRHLIDPDDQQALTRNGCVVVPFLPVDLLQSLRVAYEQIVPGDDHGLSVDYMRPDRTVMRALRDLLAPVWAEHLPRLFTGHRPVMTTFVVKHPGHESGMFLHEDRSYVDERRSRACTIWIPLAEVGPGLDNGGLEVVPGSHRLATAQGGSNTPDLFRPYERFLRSRLVPVPVEAGQAVVYDTRLLHASGPNLSDRPRLALVCAVAPVAEPLLHVVATSRTHRRVHRVTPEFFVEHHPREIEQAMPADCPIVAEYDEEPRLTPAQVASALGSEPPPVDPVVSERCRRSGDPGTFSALADRNALADGRPRGRWRPAGADLVTSAEGEVTLEADTLTLGAGALVELGGDTSRDIDLTVVEAPAVAAGVRTADRAGTFEPGRGITVPAGQAATVWNDGPGPLEVTLATATRWAWRRRGRAAS